MNHWPGLVVLLLTATQVAAQNKDVLERRLADLEKQVGDLQKELVAQKKQPFQGKAGVFPLKNADPQDVVGSIQALLQGGEGKKFRVVADNRTKTVLCIGRDDDLKLVKELLDSLDIPAAKVERNIRTFKLENADSNTLTGILQNLFGDTAMKIVAVPSVRAEGISPGASTIIVQAPAAEMKMIEGLIRLLDKGDSEEKGKQ